MHQNQPTELVIDGISVSFSRSETAAWRRGNDLFGEGNFRLKPNQPKGFELRKPSMGEKAHVIRLFGADRAS